MRRVKRENVLDNCVKKMYRNMRVRDNDHNVETVVENIRYTTLNKGTTVFRFSRDVYVFINIRL